MAYARQSYVTEKPPNTPNISPHYVEYQHEDEISLVDLWLVLARRKWLVFGSMLVVLGLAALYTFTRVPMYQSRAVVAIGSVGEHGLLEQPDAVVQRLTEEYHVHDSSETAITPPYVDEVKKEGPSAVSVTVEDTTPQGAQAFAKQVVDKLLGKHDQVFEQAVAAQKVRLDSLNRQIANFDAQSESLARHIDALQERDPGQSAVLALERGMLLSQKPALEEQRADLQLTLSALSSQPTKLIRTPSLPRGPGNIDVQLYLALGLVLGLMLGVFVAFFAEFLARVHQEMQSREDAGRD